MTPARLVQVALALAVPALAALPLAAQAPDPTAQTGFVVVSIDLPSRTFQGLLPFDVPFQIRGQVPSGVDRIEVQYQDSDACFKGSDRRGGAPAATTTPVPCLGRSCPDADGAGRWKPETPLTWNASGLTEANAAFSVLVRPPLDANRCYRFRIAFDKKLTDEQAEAFRTAARKAIDETLQPVLRLDLTRDQVEGLRGQLIGTLKCIGDSCGLRAEGRLFDPDAPAAAVVTEWKRQLELLLDPQIKRNARLRSYGRAQLVFKERLDAVAASPALGRLISGLRERARQDANVQSYLDPFDAALALVAPDDNEARARAARCLDATPRPALDETWSPDEAETCSVSYRSTGERMRQLVELIHDRSGDVEASDRDGLAALAQSGGAIPLAGETADQLAQIAHDAATLLQRREGLLDDVARYTNAMARDTLLFDASTTGGESTIRNNYVSADAGFVYAFTIAAFVPYVGTNIYFRPVNKAAPLSQRGGFGRRFALTFGVTLATIEDREPGDTAGRTRSDLFSNSSLVVGAGLRVTQSIRLGGGALVFRRKDPNPLVSNTTVGVAPYASFSFDLDVAKAFAGLGKIFSGG
jgi:hypothetical protein